MQIAIHAPQMHMPTRVGARLCSSVVGGALLILSVGTAWALVGAPAAPSFDRSPDLVQTGGSGPLRLPNGAPGDTAISYTTIAHPGSEPAVVRLYGDVAGGLAPHLAVTVTRGVGEGAAWVADRAAPVFRGTLASLPADWMSGVTEGGAWDAGEQHTYRIEVTLLDHPAAQGTAADATFRWEARPAGA
jgi:hypothetical protein